MNFSQRLGLFILIVISVAYVYFSFFSKDGIRLNFPKDKSRPPVEELIPISGLEDQPEEKMKYEHKTVKIFVVDSKGNLLSLDRECDVCVEKSCFAYAINELMKAPTSGEKSKGYTSEIPQGTKILSIREGDGNIMIDLSSAFETGGGAESTYTRVMQLIKTAKANTDLPVYLYINGRQADVIGGEGIMIKQPLCERSLDD